VVPKIGTGFASGSSFSVDASVGHRVALYPDVDAGGALRGAMAALDPVELMTLAVDVPALPAALPTAFAGLANIGTDVSPADATTLRVGAGAKYGDLRARNASKVVLDEAVGPAFQFRSIAIESGSTLLIRGGVEVRVEGDLDVDDAFVVLEDSSSSVTFYVGQDVRLDHQSKAGIDPADLSSGTSVVSKYVNPARFRVLALAPGDGGTTGTTWRVDADSAAIALLHNPLGRVEIRNGGAAYGHAVGADVRIESGSRLYYCPTLDNRAGLTSPDGPLYNADATLIDGLIDTLNAALASGATTAESFNLTFDTAWDDLVSSLGGISGGSSTQPKTQTIGQQSEFTY
jgi:hypothetical protein